MDEASAAGGSSMATYLGVPAFEGTGVGVAMLAPGWVLTEKVEKAINSSPARRAAIEVADVEAGRAVAQ